MSRSSKGWRRNLHRRGRRRSRNLQGELPQRLGMEDLAQLVAAKRRAVARQQVERSGK